MTRTSLAFIVIAILGFQAATVAEGGPVGWAGVEGGTRGGEGGTVHDVNDAATLVRLAKSSEAKVLRVRGSLTLNAAVRVGSNTTIEGIGADARLIGGGLHLSKVQNVILRHLTISQASDAISIEASHHVWVDHCDLSVCRDGLLDIKRGSDFVTMSWCHFHKHHKTCLLGHSDKPDIRQIDTGHLRVTYHHNYFDGTESRHPRVRYAEGVHVFNNFYRGNGYGVAAVMDSAVIVEGNHFEDVRQPTLVSYGDSPDPGRLIERNNIFVRSGQPESRGAMNDQWITYRYRLDDPSTIRDAVLQGAGVGRGSP